MASKRTVLIVDDDAELREALVEQLALHDEFDTVTAENGTKGVQTAKGDQVDLVLMDVGLPDIDGREAVRILRKGGFKSPIIMLTGHDTDSDTILGLESGANDYVVKPFRFAVLLARIRVHLANARAAQSARMALDTAGRYLLAADRSGAILWWKGILTGGALVMAVPLACAFLSRFVWPPGTDATSGFSQGDRARHRPQPCAGEVY